MILKGHFYETKDWNKIWEKVWALEDKELHIVKGQMHKEKLLLQIIEKPYYLT